MTTRKHASFALLMLTSIALLWKTISALMVYSFHYESSSHIILIPFITLGLIYLERHRIFAESKPVPLFAFAVIFAGAALYWLAGRGMTSDEGNQSSSAAALSLLLIWVGSFLLCYGSRASRAAAFALAFLLLMIPLPTSILERTIYLLQQGSTEISFLLFKAAGVPVLRQGFLLSVPGVTIEVAKECSGIRSSMALFITCLLAAHLFLRTSWKMALFVSLALPLAIIKNGIRIATLTLLSIYVDPSFLHGSLHRDGGFVFFLMALGMLAPALLLLQRSDENNGKPLLGHSLKAKIKATSRGVA